METFEQNFLNIYQKPSEVCEKQQKIDSEKTRLKDGYLEKIQQINEKYEMELCEYNESEKKILAFIEIAKANCLGSVAQDMIHLQPVDTGKLSKLAVKIDNSLRIDPFANELFAMALGQLQFLKREINIRKNWFGDEKEKIKRDYEICEKQCKESENQLINEILDYLWTEEFQTCVEKMLEDTGKSNLVTIGSVCIKMNLPSKIARELSNIMQGVYDWTEQMFRIPVNFKLGKGMGLIVSYQNENEPLLQKGIQSLLLNFIEKMDSAYNPIFFVDPVRFSSSALGVLQNLTIGEEPIIDRIPLSIDECQKKLTTLINNINEEEKRKIECEGHKEKKRLLIFHEFPFGYDAHMIKQIQQLYMNAEHYNIFVIIIHNQSARGSFIDELLLMMKQQGIIIQSDSNNFFIESLKGKQMFRWNILAEEDMALKVKNYVVNKKVTNKSNEYEERIGYKIKPCKKGIRQLTRIPYGIDEEGNILELDFENSNFATFICGAARSGKSTLLHTLITGIIENNHPDDVEIWLVDFKMTEFSRYIKHLPPHVRYIILDESPELVYDIIDRLTEIMNKRQIAFKGRWQKLNDIPAERYMPALLVIIDEFSIMSQIVANSVTMSKENYSEKLQNLLAKGAALGLHFIFSSQGFTSGTRGLSDFSKKQIQQRIAMKTEYSEIRETLDLRSISDEDKSMMEQLQAHYTLVREVGNEERGYLKLAKVIFISDYSKQEQMIDALNELLHTEERYDCNDTFGYIDKKTLIVDGNEYISFDKKIGEFKKYIQKQRETIDADNIFLLLGAPRKMMPIYPIELQNAYLENILIISTDAEEMATMSIIMSINESLALQNRKSEIWASSRNKIYRQLIGKNGYKESKIVENLGEICGEITRIKENIFKQREEEKYIILLGTESLFMDMEFQNDIYKDTPKKESNKPDLLTQMAMIQRGETVEEKGNFSYIENTTANTIYDARNDFKFILQQGSRLGYHFIIIFNSVEALNQCNLNITAFKHKIMFRHPKNDAAVVMRNVNPSTVAELEMHSFRYTDGLETVSFRPYLHKGIIFDGWSVEQVDKKDIYEEYLM